MLRCPPSRISLTNSDIADFERHQTARQSARFARPYTSNLRLSPGPGHQTSLSVVPADQNVGRKRAASSSSEATLHNDRQEYPSSVLSVQTDGSSVAFTASNPTEIQQHPNEHSVLCNDAARALQSVVDQRLSPPKSSPRRQVDSFFATDDSISADQQTTVQRSPLGSLDGVVEAHALQSPVEVRYSFNVSETLPLSTRETRRPTLPSAQRSRPPEPPPFSSARARRRHGRSKVTRDLHGTNSTQDSSTSLQVAWTSWEVPSAIPQLILPNETTDPLSLSLDPGAPVFVPRTRFGTATESSAEGTARAIEPRWSSIDSTHSSLNLRIRSSSEQNVDLPFFARHQSAQDVTGPFQGRGDDRNGAVHSRQRRRSRTTDQNTAISFLTPNLERYPLLRPPSGLESHRRTSGLVPLNLDHGLSVQQVGSTTSARHVDTDTYDHLVSHSQISSALVNSPGLQADHAGRDRSVSPAVSANSRSTPNLLQRPISPGRIYIRGSSLSWNHMGPQTPSFHGGPRMVSGASGYSGSAIASRQSSREGPYAATELLRMRNSPLDDLTERLSRLSASRPRSVGRSWERPPHSRHRVSLLNGDPFRPDTSSSQLAVSSRSMLPRLTPAPATSEPIDEVEAMAEDLVALSLALPPSSPLTASSQATITAPSIRNPHPKTSPRTPLGDASPVKSCYPPDSCIKRKPVPTTPRVVIYDDRKPPSTQPQTPADVNRSTRRAKTRSNTATQESPIVVGRAVHSSPPVIPERHPHRNTYPPVTPPHDGQTPAPNNDMSRLPTVTRPQQDRRPTRAHRNSEQAENDVEAHLNGLEDDRLTWLGRREQGALDVTPPREGRFEQYLS